MGGWDGRPKKTFSNKIKSASKLVSKRCEYSLISQNLELQIDTIPSFVMSLVHILRKKSFNLIWMIEEAKISLQTSFKKNDYASVALELVFVI